MSTVIDVLVLAAHPVELEPVAELSRGRSSGSVEFAAVGVGLVMAGVGAARVLARTETRSVLLIGSVGVYSARSTATEGLVVATGTRLVVPEMLFGRAELPAAMPVEQPFDARLVAELRRALPQAHLGQVATTLAITTDDELAATLARGPEDFENLEAIAVATAASAQGVPVAALFGITNAVGSTGRDQWKTNHSRVALEVARGALRFLDEVAPT